MKLINAFTEEGRKEFTAKGYKVPAYDREELKKKTFEAPRWVHFGPGNIFRAYQAEICEKLLEGDYDNGVVVVESYDYEILDKAFRPYDNLALSVVLHPDGIVEKNVIGCITESLKADMAFSEDWLRLCDIFRNPSLEIVTFSITEKGYLFTEGDLKNGRESRFAMGKLTSLLFERFSEGMYPITLQSMDNCSHNGDYVKRAVQAYAKAWVEQGIVNPEFLEYVEDETKVSYPWCMIDKITPRPSPDVQTILEKDGFEDNEIFITEKQSFTASFVNSEDAGYLVIEDSYVNGRPPLEDGGAIFTDRDTVDKVERMKVGTCLNPLHTALGTFGVPLKFTLIQDEMKDPDLYGFITRMVNEESMPVVFNPGILNPRDFVNECIEKRFVNPYMPDTPQRIATDNSQAIKMRYSGTISEYIKKGEDLNKLTFIPLIFAGYARYLVGIDDDGEPYALSPDPLAPELAAILKDLKVGDPNNDYTCLKDFFCREDVFNMNLYEVGLGEKCEAFTKEFFAGKGAIRKTLHKYVTMPKA